MEPPPIPFTPPTPKLKVNSGILKLIKISLINPTAVQVSVFLKVSLFTIWHIYFRSENQSTNGSLLLLFTSLQPSVMVFGSLWPKVKKSTKLEMFSLLKVGTGRMRSLRVEHSESSMKECPHTNQMVQKTVSFSQKMWFLWEDCI